jgi:DNA-binding NtrC family response regulator
LPTTAKPTVKLLYSESDEEVLQANASEMKKAGHHVTTAIGRAAVIDMLRRDAFDLVILGGSLSKDDRHHLPYMVKKHHEGTKILVMHMGGRHHEVDATIDASMSMHLILEKIAALLQPLGVH